MRRFFKFLHTMSSFGLAGGLAAYMFVLATTPEISTLEAHASLRASLAMVSKWLLLPSMVVCVVSGLIAMAVHFPFHDKPWVWAKALSGILVFEATLASIDAPAQQAAAATARAVAGEIDPAALATLVRDEWAAWWTLLALSAANVALAIWRPRFSLDNRKRRRAEREAAREAP